MGNIIKQKIQLTTVKAIKYSIENPKKVMWIMIAFMAACAAFVPMIKIDTDPENMLAKTEEVRVRHDELKEKFNMHDMIVIGVVNDDHPEGVFNQSALSEIYDLSKYAYDLRTKNEETGEYEGVIQRDVMTPTNMDYVESDGEGRLKFDWLMKAPPQSEKEATDIKRRLMENELFYNTVISEDGKAIALYLPITSKDKSYDISSQLKEKIATFSGENDYHITGLPVAEDTFGIEMFIQMAISAPAAMLLIFILMMLFFRKLRLVLSPLIVAMVSVICTMGLLIGTGNTVHIMSSMIPIFIMPIAVLDSVHILSEFYDRYQLTGDRKATLYAVMKELFRPMLFTSLTSAAGFASLAITPIPPVQVFGIFIGFGIILAWFLTMTFIPAYIMMTSEESLANFGQKKESHGEGALGKTLSFFQQLTLKKPALVVGTIALLTAAAAYGVSMININDNPVKWFTKSHPIRVADKELNSHFGGTYMAFLSLEADGEEAFSIANIRDKAINISAPVDGDLQKIVLETIESFSPKSTDDPYDELSEAFLDIADEYADNEKAYVYFEQVSDMISVATIEAKQTFKRPEMLNYLLSLEDHLYKVGNVGKSSSIAKMVRNVNKELHNGNEDYNVIPDDVMGVGQCLLSYQNSHLPERLRHFVSNDYKSINLWLQLKSGDNQDMEKTVAAVEDYLSTNPPPAMVTKDWFGLTYINVIWQKKMVEGMMEAFLGSFLVVFLMMTFLFRSVIWAFLCMIPLSLTILIIYGVIGWIGKDYDMPVAVLSSLALGLAVDFAIHFLVRARKGLQDTGSWAETSKIMFGEPSNAIVRNMIVIAVGFLPLLLATLIPYRTVGIILASILFLSGVITLLVLPSLIKLFKLKK